MRTIRALTLVLVAAISISNSCYGHGKSTAAQITEGVLAASLSACSSYELAHKNEDKADVLKALCATLRTAHALTFQLSHKHTYAGLKVIMALLAAYDAVTLVRQYKQLVATHGGNFLRSLADDDTDDVEDDIEESITTADTNQQSAQPTASNTFSPNIHAIAHQIELAAGLVLAMCSSQKSSSLRCEYLACLAMVAARCVTIAEQQQGLLAHTVLACIVGLMILDFSIPGSPFNTMAKERDQEFSEYIDLHADLAGCLLHLNSMHEVADHTLATPLTPHQHKQVSSFANEIDTNRKSIRNAIAAHDFSLSEVQKILASTQHFLDQKMAPVLNTYHRMA